MLCCISFSSCKLASAPPAASARSPGVLGLGQPRVHLHGLDLLLFSRVAELAGRQFNALGLARCLARTSAPCLCVLRASRRWRHSRKGRRKQTTRASQRHAAHRWSRSRALIRRGPSSSSFSVRSVQGRPFFADSAARPATRAPSRAWSCSMRVRTTSLPVRIALF